MPTTQYFIKFAFSCEVRENFGRQRWQISLGRPGKTKTRENSSGRAATLIAWLKRPQIFETKNNFRGPPRWTTRKVSALSPFFANCEIFQPSRRLFCDPANILTQVDTQHREPDKAQEANPTAALSNTTKHGGPNQPEGGNPVATLSNTTQHGEPMEAQWINAATTSSSTT